jgi:hypothetical protein
LSTKIESSEVDLADDVLDESFGQVLVCLLVGVYDELELALAAEEFLDGIDTR